MPEDLAWVVLTCGPGFYTPSVAELRRDSKLNARLLQGSSSSLRIRAEEVSILVEKNSCSGRVEYLSIWACLMNQRLCYCFVRV